MLAGYRFKLVGHGHARYSSYGVLTALARVRRINNLILSYETDSAVLTSLAARILGILLLLQISCPDGKLRHFTTSFERALLNSLDLRFHHNRNGSPFGYAHVSRRNAALRLVRFDARLKTVIVSFCQS